MFRLSVETLEAMKHIDKLTRELQLLLEKVSEQVEKETDGEFSVCTGAYSVPAVLQLYDETHKVGKAAEILQASLPDGRPLTVKWEQEENMCYEFDMYGRSFKIVVDK